MKATIPILILILLLGVYSLFLTRFSFAQSSAASLNSVEDDPISEQTLRFEHITVADGLSNANITATVQDLQGFMWFATHDGLSRYDGYGFTVYRHLSNDAGSLSHSFLNDLLVDKEGNLWIATLQGLDRFDPALERFIHHRNDPEDPNSLSSDQVTVLMEDRSGYLWIGTVNGLNRFDPDTQEITRFLHKSKDTENAKIITALLEDDDGSIWIGTEEGLNRLNPRTNTVERYLHMKGDINTLSDNRVRSLYQDREGTLWVGTCQGGLHQYNAQTVTFNRLLERSGSPIYAPLTDRSVYGKCAAGVTFIHEDQSGVFWIGSYNAGVNRYHPASDRMTYHSHDPANPTSLSDNAIISFYEDPQGRIWIGTLHAGLNKADPTGSKFRYRTIDPSSENSLSDKTIWSFEESMSGILWIGTMRGGLNRLDRSTGEFTHYFHDSDNPGSLASNGITSIYEDPSGILWIGTFGGGLSQFDPSIQTFMHYRFAEDDSTSLSGNNIWDIQRDGAGTYWIGTVGSGLNRFDPTTETFTRFLANPENPTSISNNDVWALYMDAGGTVWVGTSDGLNRFDPESKSFTTYLTGRPVTTVTKGEKGNLWAGTTTDGLYRIDWTSGSSRQYTITEGLPSNAITCVIDDESGNLWISTLSKLTRFNIETEEFRSYDIGGLEHNGYVWGSCIRSRKGEMFFGGYEGYISFFPEEIQENPYPPRVYLTGVHVLDQPILPSTGEAELRLTHGQNDLSFDYVGLDYSAPEQIRYRYQLQNYDEGWVDAGIQRTARYARIPPGEYQFRVTAANSDGVWNEEGASLSFRILPPWWRTWWAYGAYAITFALGVFAVDRFQRHRLIARERERARERELEQEKAHAQEVEQAYHELEKAHDRLEIAHENLKQAQQQLVQQEKLASLGQLTAGIAHEIKNPLNFVNNFSDVSIELLEEAREEVKGQKATMKGRGAKNIRNEKSPIKGSFGDDQKNLILEILDDVEVNLRKIHEHGSRADRIVKSMLQHSRGGEGQMQPTDLNALVKEYVNLSYHGMRAGPNRISVELELDLDNSIGEIVVNPEEMSRVVVNLCNNAFDAMWQKEQRDEEYKPKLTVRTQNKNGQLIVQVEDNGPGIPEEIRDKILQPFYTTKKGTEGTGLGLSITSDIVKAHGGEMEVESDEMGATFRVLLKP